MSYVFRDVDFAHTEVKNMIIEKKTSLPTSSKEGQLVFDDTTKNLAVYSEDAWKPVGGGTFDSMPVGFCMPWWLDTLPSDKWLFGEGQSLTNYPEARAVFGSNLPDTRGRVLVGKAASGTFATTRAAVGAETTTAVPAHIHSANHDHGAVTSGAGSSHTHTFTGAATGTQSANHTHSGTTGTNSVAHTHSGTTGTNSVAHTHSGTTGNNSVAHTHSGTTGTNSVAHTHSIPALSGTAASAGAHTHGIRYKYILGVSIADSSGFIFLRRTDASDSYTGTDDDAANSAGAHIHSVSTTASTTGTVSANHTHTITTGNNSANHTHTITTGNNSADHTHTITTGNNSANHTHLSAGSNGAEAAHTHSVDLPTFTGNTGSTGDASVSLVQPSIVVRWVFKVLP